MSINLSGDVYRHHGHKYNQRSKSTDFAPKCMEHMEIFSHSVDKLDMIDTFDDLPLFSTQNMTQKYTLKLENILLFSQKF